MDKTPFRPKIPFNIELLILKSDMVKRLGEVKSKDIYGQNSSTFHPEGLFSTTIFGEVGSEERMSRFGYIDLGLPVMHPLIYRHLIKMSSLYKGIAEGTQYAVWDEDLHDFVKATPDIGKTGLSFLMSKYDYINFKQSDSKERDIIISFLKKYTLNDIKVDKWLVIPAGMRDLIITASGKELQDAINDLYRKLLTVSSTAKRFKLDTNDPSFIDSIKIRLQKVLLEIYEYIENILDCKEGFIQGKWTKRRILYGTRNVLTAIPIKVKSNLQENRPTFDHTVVGIYQFVKAITPAAIFHIRAKFLNYTFDKESVNAYLYNMKTYEKELVEISEKTRSQWVTDDGLEDTINKLEQDEIKNSPIIVDGHYLYLIYDDGKNIEVIDDVRMLPPTYNKKYIRPMTYVELLYLSLWDVIDKYLGFTTRYPITGMGSVYPCRFYVKTTIEGREVNYKGLGMTDYVKLYEYPKLGTPYYNSMSVHVSRLGRLGADFDGDKLNLNVVWEDESLEELERMINDKRFYLDTDGSLVYSASNDISDLALKMFTE